MSKFDFRSLDVKVDRTARITLYDVNPEKPPVLICKPGTAANKPYFNAVLKRGQKNARRLRAGKMTAAMMDESRNEDRELYPKHVIVGWENVVDIDGAAVPFTAMDCEDFLMALPDWIFDDVRNQLADPTTFLDDGEPTPGEVEDTAKN